jgi:hypothetical protein
MDPASGCSVVEIVDHRVQLACDLAVQWSVVTEVPAQDLGEGEDHLPVRQPPPQPLVHVLSAQQGVLLRAGRAEVEDLTREGSEVLGSAIGVGAVDAGDAFGIVPALNKAFDGPGDSLQARVSQPVGVVGLEAGGKVGEVDAEQAPQRVCAPRQVGARWCRLQREGQRIGHTID